MTVKVSAGPPAVPGDRHVAKATRALLADELPRLRAGALAWRNGLGALLAGLIGFGLVRGRSDVTQLAPAWAATVGVLLLAALVTGSAAALLVMRAAHGRPRSAALPAGAVAADPAEVARWTEASASERALRRGVALSFACTALLAAAVGVTWYGPAKDKPRVEVRFPGGDRSCGEVVSTSSGKLVLKTPLGLQTVDLTEVDGLAAVVACDPPRPQDP
ncbi:hypothetical protein SAMN04488564_101990 [Lentzea waywayandensis]|uniref:Uncharacterized protein n=1 Tax=Lentzea waywayandensis TaxID=84724 RepID=A0A1I6D3M3_9PSEU|nr:hypothetical protein [Lentzea waywayandensis]SFR00010.1 hypothetical protein SAMN04488564_101990 [Lentzea waywayandensis]